MKQSLVFRSLVKYLFFLCLVFAPVTHAFAGDFYAILVGDTLDDKIGESVITDIDNVQKLVNSVTKHTQMRQHLIVLTGKNAISSQLKQQLEALNIQPDDTVFFYYSGHGYRTYNKSDNFPYLYLGQEGRGVDVQQINDIISAKNPRFFLSMVDCCNNYMTWAPAVNNLQKQAFPTTAAMTEAYSKLFAQSSGTLFISSATPGEYSYCNVTGGFYTLSFTKALKSELNYGDQATWENLLNTAMTNMSDYTSKQHFVFKANLN